MNKKSEHNEVYETIKRGLEDAVNGRVTEHMVEYAPVVRCKDCKWHEKNGCELLNLWMMHMDDFFCAFGEVKNNEID